MRRPSPAWTPWPRRARGRRWHGGVAAGVVLALVLGVAGWVATRSPGYSTDHVEPNDGTMWVTNDRAGLFGRLNAPAGRLDGAFAPDEGSEQTYQLDVVQAGSAVLAQDRVTGRVAPVDVRAGTLAADRAVSLAPGTPIAVGARTSVTVDPDTGEVRAAFSTDPALAAVDGLGPQSEPLAQVALAPDVTGEASTADVAVDGSGTAYAAGSGGDLVALTPTGDGRFRAAPSPLGGPLQDVHVVLTPEGPAVLDTVGGVLVRPDGSRATVSAPLTEGLPGRSSDGGEVLVATPTALLAVDLGTAAVRTVSGAGTGPAAAPVVLDGCAYAVWSGSPGRAVRACGDAPAAQVELERATALLSPHLRLNHRSVVLNDAAGGGVWSLDTGERLDDWDAVAPPRSQKAPDDAERTESPSQSRTPPRAVDDQLGARPGRTSVLHVLDNDSNPSGSVLSITRVGSLPAATGSVAISPDGQAVQLTLTPSARAATFDYEIDDGRGSSSTALVKVTVREPSENGSPVLREGYTPSVTTVANRGAVGIPVVSDWRDPDSDPVAVTEAADDDVPVGVSTDGRLRYTAPGEEGPRSVEYTVSDGRTTTTGEVPVQVLPEDSTATKAATPLPDVGRGEVGTPVVLHPLENDVPGTDPTTPGAHLELAGDVTAPDGTTVETSADAGTVSVTAGAPGTYLLAYTVRFGDAPYARGAIRVDVRAADRRGGEITAMLDQAVVHGQSAAVVDVLANDVDPAGGLLVVQAAEPEVGGVVDVAVLRGRWLRVAATRPALDPNPILVHYTVTNGAGQTATGDVSVLQLPEPEDGTPVAVDDVATVRAGDHVTVPALDNDVDPAGEVLTLGTRVEGAPREGTLPVTDPDGAAATGTDVGAAYVSGRVIRYQAPPVTIQRTVAVTYVVQDPGGHRATGTVRVTVVPPPAPDRPNRAPSPATLEGRVVAGDTITVTVAGSGADPDGDSTTLSGLDSAPRLGRVLEVSPSSITYQAYPTSGGTDDFTYRLTDRYGKVGVGTVRIAVAPPGDPQPVVAVDDQVTVAPGATVVVDPVRNDIQPIGERAVIEPLAPLNPDLGGAAALDEATGLVTATAPEPGRPLTIRYAIVGASGEPSTATITVRGQKGVNLPPVPRNALARPEEGATTVSVDVLAGAVDPDDPDAALRVTQVFNAPGATISGGQVTVPVSDTPQVLSFEVVDAGGAAALGLLHVAVGGSGAPSVRPDALIRVDRDDTTTVALEDVVVDPAGRRVTLAGGDRLAASPPGKVRVEADGEDALAVTGLAGYVGPAAVSFEVTTQGGGSARRAFLSVPVQVGPETPVLRCPPTAIDVVVGGQSRPLAVPQLCHVWTARPEALADLTFTGRFEDAARGLSVSTRDAGTLVVGASSEAVPGQEATLLVTAAGTEATPARMTVRVAPADPPELSPVSVTGVKAGTTRSVDVAGYISSQLGDPQLAVVGVERVSGDAASVTRDGPTTLSITPDPSAHGRITFRVTVTDVGTAGRRDRLGTGTLTVDVLGVPDAPGRPVEVGPTLSRSARIAWTTPADNGLPVEYYDVTWAGGEQRCSASPCLVTGLANATAHRFTVVAHNAVGDGPPSPPSATVTPDEVPGAVVNPRVVDPRDRSVTVTWSPAPTKGSPVDLYLLTWPGGKVQTTGTTAQVSGLDNMLPVSFTVKAHNNAGWGPAVTVNGQSAGAPRAPDAPTVDPVEIRDGAAQSAHVSWNAVSPNGPGDTTYVVTRSGPDGEEVVCRQQTATSCDAPAVDNDGSTYSYRVTAANDVHDSPPSPPSTQVAVGRPGDFSRVSATATGDDRTVDLEFTSPDAHDSSVTITCTVGGTGCGQWTAPERPTRFQEDVTVPANGQEWTITLTATNSAGLATATQVTSDVVYGPLGRVRVGDVGTVGPWVSFTVSVDPNGRPADVTVEVTDGRHTVCRFTDTTGGSAWSASRSCKVGFDNAVDIRATVDRGRDGTSDSASVRTGAGTLEATGEKLATGEVRLTLTGRNLSPSATMVCTVDRQGAGGQATVTFQTGSAGNGSRTVPTSEFAATSGSRYAITCDDGASPASPVSTDWTAP